MKSKNIISRGFFIPLTSLIAVALLIMSMTSAATGSAKVKQMQGVYIFMDADPLDKFTTLGTVKAAFAASSNYSDIRDKLLKKLKKEYPEANGMIINLKPGGVDQADAIKFE